MRFISETHTYGRDFHYAERGRYRLVIRNELPDVIAALAADQPLPVKYRDHMLTGNWASHRECHIKPDLLLLYMKIDDVSFEDKIGELRLVRLGSHSELF